MLSFPVFSAIGGMATLAASPHSCSARFKPLIIVGGAAALVLTALGVPRETVIADYLLTNQYLDLAKLIDRSKAPGPANPLAWVGEK